MLGQIRQFQIRFQVFCEQRRKEDASILRLQLRQVFSPQEQNFWPSNVVRYSPSQVPESLNRGFLSIFRDFLSHCESVCSTRNNFIGNVIIVCFFKVILDGKRSLFASEENFHALRPGKSIAQSGYLLDR